MPAFVNPHSGVVASARLVPLDGLRAFSVLAVMVHHTAQPTVNTGDLFDFWSPGAFGVRVFFVLSGFLITGILAEAQNDASRADFSRWHVWRAFVMRRALRIFPLAYLAMAVAWVVGSPGMREHGWWHVLYLGNISMGLYDGNHSGLAHFWSLALEEQFYLLWPVFILIVPVRLWRRSILALVFVTFVLRIVTTIGYGATGAYLLPWSRMDALLFGGWLAIAMPRLPHVAVVSALLALLSLAMPPIVSLSLRESALVLACGCLVLGVVRGWGRAVLSARPLVYIGTISYGLYVWQSIVPRAVPFLENTLSVSLGFPVTFGLHRFLAVAMWTFVFANLSWFALEKPFNGLKRRYPYVPEIYRHTRLRRDAGEEQDSAAAPA